jgi:hypothetical protein
VVGHLISVESLLVDGIFFRSWWQRRNVVGQLSGMVFKTTKVVNLTGALLNSFGGGVRDSSMFLKLEKGSKMGRIFIRADILARIVYSK